MNNNAILLNNLLPIKLGDKLWHSLLGEVLVTNVFQNDLHSNGFIEVRSTSERIGQSKFDFTGRYYATWNPLLYKDLNSMINYYKELQITTEIIKNII